MTQEQFKDSMAYLGIAYGKEFTAQELTIYYDFLKEFSDETLVKAIKSIIKTSKFLPKITELLEICEKYKEQARFDVLEFMKEKGYFKTPIEYEKATLFMERGIVPKWLQEDINEYYKMMRQDKLDHKETLLIGG